MFTDIAGYTSISQSDEKAAMEMLSRHNGIIRPILSRFHGREVKTIGDSFLVEFGSAMEATECAVEIQSQLAAFNKSEAPKIPMHIRIGIHVGDVVHQGGDVFGDAVNLASRVQPLSEPDGICISEQVFVQVRNKLSFLFVPLPPQSLKGVQFEMKIYKVIAEQSGGSGLDHGMRPLPRTRVAVLPFTNISHDKADDYFADGVTEELITAISRVHDLKVIARTSSARYKGTSKSVAEIGRELGVGSVLEGSTRMAGNRVRVTAQLIDASTEEHLWADNYDRQLDDVFSIQSEIAESVSEILKVQLLSGEKKGLERRPTSSSSAFVRYLKGRAALHNRKKTDLFDAKRLFEEAIAEDPGFASAYVGLADALFLLGEYNHLPAGEAMRSSRAQLDKALSIDPNIPEGRIAHANHLQHDYRFAEAVKEFEAALAVEPNYAQGRHWFGVCLWDMDRKDQAFAEMATAEELDPLSVVIAFNMAVAHEMQGDGVKAMESVSKIKELDSGGFYADLALSFIFELRSDLRAASIHLRQALESRQDDLDSLARLGKLYGLLGETAKAREILSKLEQQQYRTSFQLATVMGGLGEKDKMFGLLEKAMAERSLIFRAFWWDCTRLGIRDDPRYRSLVTSAGLS